MSASAPLSRSDRMQLNATFAPAMAKRGSVAFISQSGALCAGILDWSLRENVGFSAFVSVRSDAVERDLRAGHGEAGQRRLHQPERRALRRHSRLEPARKCRLQRLCLG